jgi:hypothetical protein
MATTKRLTLNKLISYVLDHHGLEEHEANADDMYEIMQENVNQIEDIKFDILKVGDVKPMSDFSESLKEIFDPFIRTCFRHGSISHFADKSLNLSLLDSVLTCLIDAYRTLPPEEKEIYIKNMRDKLISDLNNTGLFKQYDYKSLGWKLKDLKDSLKLYKNNRMVLRFITDYFNINIFLLNVLEDKIYAIYGEENFNMFKGTIFLSFYNDIFEPLTYEQTYLWSYSTEPLKKLVNVDKQKIIVMDLNFGKTVEPKIFTISSEDLSKYMEDDSLTEEINDTNIEPNNMFDENIEDNDITNALNMTVDDHEDTDIQVEQVDHKKDIFCKKSENVIKEAEKIINKKSKDIRIDDNNKKVKTSKKKVDDKNIIEDIGDVDKLDDNDAVIEVVKLDNKMKLADLQVLAAQHGININVESKGGKQKAKTKAVLYEELSKKLTK